MTNRGRLYRAFIVDASLRLAACVNLSFRHRQISLSWQSPPAWSFREVHVGERTCATQHPQTCCGATSPTIPQQVWYFSVQCEGARSARPSKARQGPIARYRVQDRHMLGSGLLPCAAGAAHCCVRPCEFDYCDVLFSFTFRRMVFRFECVGFVLHSVNIPNKALHS